MQKLDDLGKNRAAAPQAADTTAQAQAGCAQVLAGRCILFVEDEAIIAVLIDDMLRELGAIEISHASNIAEALDLLDNSQPHVALLDLNLGCDLVYPVAECLRARSIPFVFASGFGQGGLSGEWSDHAILQKPFDTQMLSEALCGALGDAR